MPSADLTPKGPHGAAAGSAQFSARSREGGIGAAHLLETMRGAGPALLVPIALAAVVDAFFWPTRQWLVGTCVVGALCALSLILSIMRRHCPAPFGAATNANWTAAALAALFGATFAILPVQLYPVADPAQRLMVLAALCGAIANLALLGPAWPLGPAYVAPLVVGGFVGLAGGGDMVSTTLALMLVLAGGGIGVVLDRNRQFSSRGYRDRVDLDDQAFAIQHLLLDFEETAHEWLWETDAQMRLRQVPARMAEAAGVGVADLEGVQFKKILREAASPYAGGDSSSGILKSMKTREAFRNRVVAVDRLGGMAWWRLSGRPIRDIEGRFVGFRGVAADVTEARTAEARIAYLANHDPFTGLPNRVNFRTHVRRECAAAEKGGRGGALLSLDLDGFHGINGRLGHAAGDEVLQQVARRLVGIAPSDTMVARVGGDEFAIWCATAVPAKATAMAEHAIAVLSAPFTLSDGAQVEIGASVGIALTPKHATDPDLLLGRADLSLHRAKADGRRTSRIFIDDYERSLVVQRSLEADLRLALARGEFQLHYQPIVDVRSGEVVCFETLIRWKSPSRGFVSPADFIPAAESAGLIVAIDRWVLQQACKDATSWPDDIHVAVNISPHHFRNADLVQDVEVALHLSGLDPRRLDVEVTEGVFLDKSASALDTLHALRRRGVLIALDDFGTGYSSLSYLINFPIDKIKIDRVFVRDLNERHESQAIVDAILTLARKLSLKVVAEGIETSEQALALALRRCDQIQGYLLARPQPQPAVATMLAETPERFRQAVPTHVNSALGMALALKKQAG